MDYGTCFWMSLFGGCILILIPLFIKEGNKIREIFAHCIFAIGIIAVLFGLFIIFAYGFIDTKTVVEKEPYSIEHIMALGDDSKLSGHMHLRSGYINETMYYQYMVKLSNGGIVYNKVPESSATIYYTDDNNYRVEWYHVREWKWFLYESSDIQRIYIPNGSVVEDYNIDLE